MLTGNGRAVLGQVTAVKGKGQNPNWAGKAVRPGGRSDQVFASLTRSSRAKTALEQGPQPPGSNAWWSEVELM